MERAADQCLFDSLPFSFYEEYEECSTVRGWLRELRYEARKFGLPFGKNRRRVKGAIDVSRISQTEVAISFRETDDAGTMSLLVSSTSPDYEPVDIMGWCQGYGSQAHVKEWLRPSTWIQARGK